MSLFWHLAFECQRAVIGCLSFLLIFLFVGERKHFIKTIPIPQFNEGYDSIITHLNPWGVII